MLEFCFPCLSRVCGVVRIDMVRLKPEVPLFFDPIIKRRLERVRVSEVNIDMCIFVGGCFKTPDPPRVLFLDSVGKHATNFFNLSLHTTLIRVYCTDTGLVVGLDFTGRIRARQGVTL